MSQDSEEKSFWRRCEIAWAGWLQANGHTVVHLCEALGNSPRTKAPLLSLPGRGGKVRAPDLQSSKAGVVAYWEVKSRLRPDVDALSGVREFWIEFECFRDYVQVERNTGHPVHLVLYEAPTSTAPGRWLNIDLGPLRKCGHEGMRSIGGGEQRRAWIWPASAMHVVPGPSVALDGASIPVIPGEERGEPTPESDFEIFESELRSSSDEFLRHGPESAAFESPNRSELQRDRLAALDVLRRKLGIPVLPRYSVLRVGSGQVADVLGLLHYGIRVFLVTSERPAVAFDPVELRAFEQCRLLEWSVVADLPAGYQCTVADGGNGSSEPSWLQQILDRADAAGGINARQYRVVHAPVSGDVLVSAGAGTGKTETMSERLVFLLATATAEEHVDGSTRPADLSLDQVGLVTFTREAAREMRSRLARTIMLRQRLARRCIHPAAAWLMQLGRAQVSTLHMFARTLLRRTGAPLGLSRDFRVSAQLTRLREILLEELSPHLESLYRRDDGGIPPVHLWQRHVETVWNALENNGVPLVAFDEPLPADFGDRLEWGGDAASGPDAEAARITRCVIENARQRFGRHCVEEQVVPAGQLVPAALLALRNATSLPDDGRQLRFLFVDEFQDTDALQMDLLLELRTRLGTRLFVVGDAKQGIYRFRGAEGNAFEELKRRVAARKLEAFLSYSLTRNFRSGGKLLDSIHPWFERWGALGLLSYAEGDRLQAEVRAAREGEPIRFRRLKYEHAEFAGEAARQVARWRAADATASIAVLCRRNSHAVAVQTAIRGAGGSCDLLVGGSFYTTPAVREMRVLLEAVVNSHDDAALLELSETRWAGALFSRLEEPPFIRDDADCWRVPVAPLWSWGERVVSIAASDSFHREDLSLLRRRVLSLRSALRTMSAMAFSVECWRWLAPQACAKQQADDDAERLRYARCMDHLITLMDAQFADSPATAARLLEWLRLQIATNSSEDEPVDREAMQGRTTALTVHKSKGLEFDYVLVPNTWTSFGIPKQVGTRVAVLQEAERTRRVLWAWDWANGGESQIRGNLSTGDDQRWSRDDLETRKEEARLLYVAMTRVRSELVVFRPERQRPYSWHGLLDLEAP